MASILKFDTSTSPISMFEVDDGRLRPEPLKANETLTLNSDGTITLVETHSAFIETKVFAPTSSTTDDPSFFSRISESFSTPDGAPLTEQQAHQFEDRDDTDHDGSDDDAFTGSAGDDHSHGGRGRDTMSGGDGDDDLGGDEGDDNVDGGAGHDRINGGEGNDTLSGGAGNDHLYGRSASAGSDGADSISGGAGSDYLQGNAGNDTLSGGDGADRINGGGDDDVIVGDAGNDRINGNLGNDTASGGVGDDELRGGKGNDSLDGGDGADRLTGDLGADTLSGGAGRDEFHFSDSAALLSGSGPDMITDFQHGIDEIELDFDPSALLVGTAQADFAAARTAAQALLDGHAGNGEVAAVAVGADTYLFFSGNGGATVDSSIELVGVSPSTLTLSAFG